MLLLLIKPKGYVYSRFQVAFQIVLRILINSNLRNMLFCNHITFTIHFATFVRTPPIVSKYDISFFIYTFIVPNFQNFHDYCRPDRENTAKMDNYFLHCISNVKTAEPSSEPSFEVCGQNCKFHSVNSFQDG